MGIDKRSSWGRVQCQHCGAIETAPWSRDIIPGQDLGVRLQGFLGWMGNYGHLPYEKQQEMLWELGQIEIGLGTLVATNQRVEQAIHQQFHNYRPGSNNSSLMCMSMKPLGQSKD